LESDLPIFVEKLIRKGDKKDPVRPKPYRAFENITSWSVQNEICFM
jgi:hypothetical protein